VRGMINSDTMQEMLEEEWDGEAIGFYPDWGGSDHDDEGVGAVLTQGSSASSWLGPETPSEPSPAAPSAVPAATQLSAAAPPPRGATGSTTLAAVDVTTAVVDVGSEVGRPQDEKPWLVVNSQGRPCAHWERRSPPLADSLATFDEGGFRYDVPRGEFRVATLVSFFERLHCGERLTPPREEPFTWSRGANAALGDQMHSHGRWFRFAYREPHPAALPGTDTSDPFVWRHAWYDYERCIHSTSVYNVPKVLRDGLLPGGREGKGSVQGVYCYPMEGVALATKSSGYCVYSSPCEDGWFWGFRC